MKALPKETDILLLVENQEQSNLIQKICFALNVRWISSGQKPVEVNNGMCIQVSTYTNSMQIASGSFHNTDTETFINEYYEVLGLGARPKRVMGLGWIFTLETGMEILVPEKEGANLLILKEAIKEDL